MTIKPIIGEVKAQPINDNFSFLASQINNFNGSPKGTYATLSALQTAYPNGAVGVYVITADGKWYYWNGNAWTAGGVYQSQGISDKSITPRQLADNVSRVVNMSDSVFGYDYEKIILPAFEIGAINASGANASNPQKIRSDFFSVNKDFEIKILDSSYEVGLFKYDSNLVLKSFTTYQSSVKVSNTADFYRITVYKKVLENVTNVNVYADSVVLGTGKNIINTKIENNELIAEKANKRMDLYGIQDIIITNGNVGSLSPSDGQEAVNPQRVRTDFFQSFNDFTIKLLDESYNFILFTYNSNKDFVSVSSFITSGILTVKNVSGYFYRLVISKDILENIVDESTYIDAVSILIGNAVNPITPPYVGKKLMLIGDSITAIGIDDRGWPKYFTQIIKNSTYRNVAVSGATWCDKPGTIYDGNPVINGPDNNVNNVIGNQIQKIINNNYEAPELIMIACGTNDEDVTSYTMTDAQIEMEFYNNGAVVPLLNANRKNFAGAIRYAVEKLRDLYPNAQIFLCTPLQRYSDNTSSYPIIKTKGDLIKKIGQRLSVPVIDSMESGVYGLYAVNGKQTLDYNDGLHLSAIGARKVGEYNARKIINWFSF
ncbi:SGNH/GDSL hydrolase family protein [Bacillus cereus]|uniref:SGNH/GDSL hydrolase family protein n=1 Tax=Bacillus cereus TaxID=1396 RepID=UPI00115A617B|nr:SGNH/GDSL hydrolase family protein [Bacillus cereus]TQR48518.1 hypothetical protein DJ027_22590 [Bacillus cereus]